MIKAVSSLLSLKTCIIHQPFMKKKQQQQNVGYDNSEILQYWDHIKLFYYQRFKHDIYIYNLYAIHEIVTDILYCFVYYKALRDQAEKNWYYNLI